MRHVETIRYTVGDYLLSYFINGDASGLTDEEQQAAEHFMGIVSSEMPEGCTFTHLAHVPDESAGFDQCEVTGLRGDCAYLDAVYFGDDDE